LSALENMRSEAGFQKTFAEANFSGKAVPTVPWCNSAEYERLGYRILQSAIRK